MELSQEFLIDMAINALGYILAGVISVILFSFFKKKKSTVDTNEFIEESSIQDQPVEMELREESVIDNNYEFITFKSDKMETKKITNPEPVKSIQESTTDRMNRKEAINIAKKMLVAGATHEKIKRILPVSESELALLSLNLK